MLPEDAIELPFVVQDAQEVSIPDYGTTPPLILEDGEEEFNKVSKEDQ